MAYTKNTWADGDIVTSEKLNHMEDGIADASNGGTLVIGGFSYNSGLGTFTGTSDKTWQEIHDALVTGKECIAILHDGDGVNRMVINSTWSDNESSTYYISIAGTDVMCNSPEGYPSIINSGDFG